jgi:putative methionine-R-sulfoxide reductase with GAF domain
LIIERPLKRELETVQLDIHEDLIQGSIRGDRKAQYRLYQLYAKAMFNVCARMMPSHEDAEDMLQVGPYQGPLACIDLKQNTGVCWAGINQGKTIVVPDVHAFPGHIACDSRSQSEIVVPLINSSGLPWAVLDVDSTEKEAFDETDAFWLEKIVLLVRDLNKV